MNKLIQERTNKDGQIYAICPECDYPEKMDWSDELDIWICPMCRTVGYTKDD